MGFQQLLNFGNSSISSIFCHLRVPKTLLFPKPKGFFPSGYSLQPSGQRKTSRPDEKTYRGGFVIPARILILWSRGHHSVTGFSRIDEIDEFHEYLGDFVRLYRKFFERRFGVWSIWSYEYYYSVHEKHAPPLIDMVVSFSDIDMWTRIQQPISSISGTDDNSSIFINSGAPKRPRHCSDSICVTIYLLELARATLKSLGSE